jgi:predicted enzyme related to lactoylglutathione lyase
MSLNTVCWTDIPVKNLDRAITFYTAVLGSKVSKEGDGGFTFGLLPHTEQNASGCLVEMEDNEPSQKGPLVYLSVEGRIDAAVAEVEKNKGRVVSPKHSIGPHGFRAIIIDSEGNKIALHSHAD